MEEIAGAGIPNGTVLDLIVESSDGNAFVRDKSDASKQGWARRCNLIDITPDYRPKKNWFWLFLK